MLNVTRVVKPKGKESKKNNRKRRKTSNRYNEQEMNEWFIAKVGSDTAGQPLLVNLTVSDWQYDGSSIL